MEISCIPVPKDYLAAVWPVVKPMLEKAVATAPGKLGIDDVIANAFQGSYVIWLALVDGEVKGALTTRVIEYPRCRAMAIDWVGGSKMKLWFGPAMRAMKEHARLNGCSRMEGYGREAWLKWLKPEGWRPEYVAFKVELSDGQ